MSDTVYRLTQVFPPQVPPGELRDLAGKFEAVRNASLACAQDAKAVVDGVLASNEGEAVTAFRDKMHGEQASLRQLENLADAALRTRDAHRSAAAGVSAAQVGMAAIAHVAETFLHRAESSLPFPLSTVAKQVILSRARHQLLLVSEAANQQALDAYQGVSLPEPLPLSTEQARGTLPDGAEEDWAQMSTDERTQLLEALYDDVTQDWPEDERPEFFYYSDDPDNTTDGLVERPAGLSPGANGAAVRSENAIYLNIDMVSDDVPPNPSIIHTVVHELRHIEQFHMQDHYDVIAPEPGLIEEIREGTQPDPFVERGSTLDEVERIKHQQRGNRDFYLYRPIEVGARRAATEYEDGLTREEWEGLMQQ